MAAGATIMGEGAERLPNTLFMAVEGWDSPQQLITLDLMGLMVSVVPRVVEQFDNVDQQLPLITRVVIGISDQMKVPVKYIGVGEGIEDLQLFNRHEFVDSLFN